MSQGTTAASGSNHPPVEQQTRPTTTQSQQNHGSGDTLMRDVQPASMSSRTHNPQSRSPAVENRHQSRVEANTSKAAKASFTGLTDKKDG
jgi:hypothetical protein